MTSTDVARSTTTGVKLTGLTKSFKSPQGPVHAVRSIDLRIDVGETVALLGPNGAGKSTTIDMILGLLKPDGGTIDIDSPAHEGKGTLMRISLPLRPRA